MENTLFFGFLFRGEGEELPYIKVYNTAMPKTRLDLLLVERGLAESRAKAQAMIMAGQVRVDDQVTLKPATGVSPDSMLTVDSGPRFVSRGGEKLDAALEAFGIDVSGQVCADVGASTGGFTDCLLQAGAARVHAVDVGYGQLAWSLTQDPRVVVHDRRNIRRLHPDEIGEPIELVVMDCSFIAAAKVLPHLPRFLAADADVVVLVKPQFELDPGRVGKGGIVRDEDDRHEALTRARAAADDAGLRFVDAVASEVQGRTGNREWLMWLRWRAGSVQLRPPEPSEPPDSSR